MTFSHRSLAQVFELDVAAVSAPDMPTSVLYLPSYQRYWFLGTEGIPATHRVVGACLYVQVIADDCDRPVSVWVLDDPQPPLETPGLPNCEPDPQWVFAHERLPPASSPDGSGPYYPVVHRDGYRTWAAYVAYQCPREREDPARWTPGGGQVVMWFNLPPIPEGALESVE